jgi:hypothetical protein
VPTYPGKKNCSHAESGSEEVSTAEISQIGVDHAPDTPMALGTATTTWIKSVKTHCPGQQDRTDSRFDATVRRLAPIINQLRVKTDGRSTRKLADRLNEMGMAGPNGKPLSYTTMRRVLQRLPELGLGDGPSNRSRAASDRKMPYRYRPGRRAGVIGLKNTDIAKAEP